MSTDATIATWKLPKHLVTPTQKLILLSYADRAGESFECWPSNGRLQKDTGFNKNTICENKQKLLDKGLISYTGEKKGRTKSIDVIRLNYVDPREGDIDEVNCRSSTETNTALKSSCTEMRTGKQYGNPYTEPKRLEPKRKEYISPISSKSGQKKNLGDYKKDERFMRFYNAYPKKQDPMDAYKAFLSIVGNDDELLERILVDLELRKKSHTQWQDKQYIKYPAVYLRKAEYEGEIYNERQEAEEKKKNESIAAQAKADEQTRLSQKSFEREIQERTNNEQDGKAYRKIKKSLDGSTEIPEGLKNLRKSMGIK